MVWYNNLKTLCVAHVQIDWTDLQLAVLLSLNTAQLSFYGNYILSFWCFGEEKIGLNVFQRLNLIYLSISFALCLFINWATRSYKTILWQLRSKFEYALISVHREHPEAHTLIKLHCAIWGWGSQKR